MGKLMYMYLQVRKKWKNGKGLNIGREKAKTGNNK